MRILKALRREVEYMADHAKEVLVLTWSADVQRVEHLNMLGGGHVAILVPDTVDEEQRIEYPTQWVVELYTKMLHGEDQ